MDLFGKRLRCILKDGRSLEGNLTCIDRECNLILCDCVESRVLEAGFYCERGGDTKRLATRSLQQAMVPGDQIEKVTLLV